MSAVISRAQALYRAGVCPGCGTNLEIVAGAGHHHTLDGLPVLTTEVELGALGICPWSADDLTSLVLIGAGVVTEPHRVAS